MNPLSSLPGWRGQQQRRATVFNYLGCAGCPVTTTFTLTANSRSVRFQPFSDFLVHDMGTLGDGVGNDGHTVDVTRRMRTAPLWGLFLWSLYRRTARYSTTTHPRRAA